MWKDVNILSTISAKNIRQVLLYISLNENIQIMKLIIFFVLCLIVFKNCILLHSVLTIHVNEYSKTPWLRKRLRSVVFWDGVDAHAKITIIIFANKINWNIVYMYKYILVHRFTKYHKTDISISLEFYNIWCCNIAHKLKQIKHTLNKTSAWFRWE